MGQSILVVDDELSMREFLSILLERNGYETYVADTPLLALNLIAERSFDLIISDINMPDLDGIQLLKKVREISPGIPVVMITAFSTAEQAVAAMKHGAVDYIPKPFKVEEIKIVVQRALANRATHPASRLMHFNGGGSNAFRGLVGSSKPMRELFGMIEKVALSMANVLILGESGTGKELAAQAIHSSSLRREKAFVAVNCGAIPETLMESELFGHKKGSFTGAVADRAGLFEQAAGGTLFLDEIGELPLQLQTKLLRVLQEREFRQIGGTEARKADVRLIAASNRDIEEQVREGTFREDLFFRLNVVQIRMPSLRERSEDIPLLIEHFYRRFSPSAPEGHEMITADALERLRQYPFPGNVRELENLVERCLVLGTTTISLDSLPLQVRGGGSVAPVGIINDVPDEGMDLQAYLDAIEKHLLDTALLKSCGVRKRAAELLGLSFRSFRYRLAKFGMDDS